MAKPPSSSGTDIDTKWLFMFLGVGVIVIMLPLVLSSIFDTQANRIAACMQGQNMEYVDGDCRSIQPTE